MNATRTHAKPDPGRPVKFFLLETAEPTRGFWGVLARLLCDMAERARRRGETRR